VPPNVEDPAGLDFCYLTTSGRRSGASHRIEIWFVLHEGTVYLLSGGRDASDWVRNLMVSADVVLEIAGRRRTTRGRVIEPGTDEDALARRLLVEKYQPGYGGDLTDWGQRSLAVAIDWP
jgi:deazaflavin-dependent oxidoreductase (nitroreductase family)